MDRRSFLALGASGAALAVTGGCAHPSPAASASASSSSGGGPLHVDLEEASIADLSARMQRGELSSRDLVQGYVARIDAVDRAGPTLAAMLEVNPDALAIAAALDDERRAKGPRGPLHGIPIVLKDNIDTGDRMQTSAGSLAFAGVPAPTDAPLVARLRRAGAVVLGKTNLSEWANIRDTRSTSGWSARGGLTRNPYCLDRNTSGSSAGSAAAVAASLATAGVGTETIGSILSPASIQGLVGIKPTVRLVSAEGIVPVAHSQDVAGPMARTVADAAIVLGVMAGRDYSKSLAPGGARGKRIGVVRDQPWLTPAAGRAFDAALADLGKLGAVLVDVEIPHVADALHAALDVMLFELKADLEVYLAPRAHATHLFGLEDVMKFNQAHAAEELRWFGQDLFEQSLAKGKLNTAEYARGLATCRSLAREQGIDAALSASKLDAFVAPTTGPAWVTDLAKGDGRSGGGFAMAAIAGYPSLTVPSGETHGLPLGVCFYGGPLTEPTLIAIAYAYEQATRHRAKPRYLPTLPMNVLT